MFNVLRCASHVQALHHVLVEVHAWMACSACGFKLSHALPELKRAIWCVRNRCLSLRACYL